MTIRLDVDVNDTVLLLGTVVGHLNQDHRVMFLTDPGMGQPIVQRLRVRLSRARKSMERKGKIRKYFTLHSSVHKHTELDGKRYDCVTLWRSRSVVHVAHEELERMLDGQSL